MALDTLELVQGEALLKLLQLQADTIITPVSFQEEKITTMIVNVNANAKENVKGNVKERESVNVKESARGRKNVRNVDVKKKNAERMKRNVIASIIIMKFI